VTLAVIRDPRTAAGGEAERRAAALLRGQLRAEGHDATLET
jgi:hypothetical protein